MSSQLVKVHTPPTNNWIIFSTLNHLRIYINNSLHYLQLDYFGEFYNEVSHL